MRSLKTIFLLLLAVSIYGQDTQKMELAYQKKDFKLVIAEGTHVLAEYPEDVMANHLTGRALTELKQFEEAKKYLEKATQNPAPEWMKAWSYGYLGLCNFATDNPKAAKRYLETAVQMYATENATQYAEKRLNRFQLTAYFDDWEIVEKPNIRFHLQPGHGIADTARYC
ncbi:MAG: tetratricopeptide repeat protein [Bacteroidetes bacterium]|nr:MAG: tetratricopeptide repeat protein [Bacteroidota bacterium]